MYKFNPKNATGLLHFHELTVTILKMHNGKQKPVTGKYKDYKIFQIKSVDQNFHVKWKGVMIALLLIFIQNYIMSWVSMRQ